MRLLEEGLIPVSSLAADESIFRLFIIDPETSDAEEVDVLVSNREELPGFVAHLPAEFVDELEDYLGEVWGDAPLRWEKAL